jgi:hypothetical protein
MLDREWIAANPASRIPEPGEEASRDRVLSDNELRELWAALECLARVIVQPIGCSLLPPPACPLHGPTEWPSAYYCQAGG